MTGLYHQLLRKQRAEREAKKAKERLARLRVQQGKEPTPEPVKPAKASPAKAPEITRADVDDVLSRKRSASAEQLQYIIAHAKKYELTTYQRDRLGLDLSIAVAAQMREARGIREDPTTQFFSEVLNVEQTPRGLLYEAGWFKRELMAGSKDIENCTRHRPPNCACWAASRGRLYAVRQAFGENSPEGYTALKVWNALEQIERSSQGAGDVERV